MAAMADDDDLADLANSLLSYDRRQEDERLGIDELAEGLLGDAHISVPDGDGDGDANMAPQPSPLAVQQQPDATLLYGPPAVRNLGNQIQLKLMNRVFAQLARQNKRQIAEKSKQLDKTSTAVLDHFVHSSKTLSIAAAASFVGVGEKNLKRGISSTAGLTLFGGTWLCGAMLSIWRRLMGQMGESKKVFCLTRMKYDETPLRLKVAEYNSLFGLHDSDVGASSVRRTSNQEEYRFAKIFRVLFKLGFLDQN